MCKRNSPNKIKKITSTGCVRETPKIKKKRSQHGICKRNSPDKNEGRSGYAREIPHIKTKSAMAV